MPCPSENHLTVLGYIYQLLWTYVHCRPDLLQRLPPEDKGQELSSPPGVEYISH